MIEHIDDYDLLFGKGRENKRPSGFAFDMDTFENLIDGFNSETDIATILGVTAADLDRFCKICYKGCTFESVFRQLNAMTSAMMRRAIKKHAEGGNVYAMKLMAKNYLGMEDDDSKKQQSITISFKDDLK